MQATLYPGIGAIEYSNLSVGRGTDTPFEQVGAPWIDGVKLAELLNARKVPGVRFYPVRFTPTASKFSGEECQGVFMVVTDRAALAAGAGRAGDCRRAPEALWQPVRSRGQRTPARVEGEHRADPRRRRSGGDRRLVGGRREPLAAAAQSVPALPLIRLRTAAGKDGRMYSAPRQRRYAPSAPPVLGGEPCRGRHPDHGGRVHLRGQAGRGRRQTITTNTPIGPAVLTDRSARARRLGRAGDLRPHAAGLHLPARGSSSRCGRRGGR